VVIRGLKSGAIYVFLVRARTVAGFGRYSGKLYFQTMTEGEGTDNIPSAQIEHREMQSYHIPCMARQPNMDHYNMDTMAQQTQGCGWGNGLRCKTRQDNSLTMCTPIVLFMWI
jgi:hypothetical protein